MDAKLEELELRAYENDAKAQYKLAMYYKKQTDYKRFLDWLKKSAKADNADAKIELAKLYLEGNIVDKDEELAISLLSDEINTNEDAKLILGKYYISTRDEEKEKEGLSLLLSIANENSRATYEMGMGLCFLDDNAGKLWALNLDYNNMQNQEGEIAGCFSKLDLETIMNQDFKSKEMHYAGVRLLAKAKNMGEKRAAYGLAVVCSDNRFVNPDKELALNYLNELDNEYWIDKCFILNLWNDYDGIYEILSKEVCGGNIKDYLLARLYENYGFKKYDLCESDKLYKHLFNNIQSTVDDDEKIILSDLYCRGKGINKDIQKARQILNSCRVSYAQNRCGYDGELYYYNAYSEEKDLDLKKYYSKSISLYNKNIDFDNDKYIYMFVNSKVPYILEKSKLIYNKLYNDLKVSYCNKEIDENDIVSDISDMYISNIKKLSCLIAIFLYDNWNIEIENEFCYNNFLEDLFNNTTYNNYIKNIHKRIEELYKQQQVEFEDLMKEFFNDCNKAKVLKNTIKSKKTAQENMKYSPTFGDIIMGTIAYGTINDTRSEYYAYSEDVRSYIEASEDEKSDKLQEVKEKFAGKCVDNYSKKLRDIIDSEKLEQLYEKILIEKKDNISNIIRNKIISILKESGVVSKLFDSDFSGDELFEKCKNASEPLRYLLITLETDPTNKKYYEYAISNYGDSNGELYALAAMNGINIFDCINKIIENNIFESRENFEKVLNNLSVDKKKYIDEYNKKHEQMLNEKITCKKIEYSMDSEKQKILTADYEKFLMTFNADTSKYLNRYKSVANSYSQINELLDIKSEEREFSKIIKHLCVEILQCNDDDKKLITNEQLKLAEELASVYEQKKSIDKDDFVALSNKNNFLYDDKSEDEMINVVLKEKDVSSYITVSKRLKNMNPVYALLFAVKHCIYSDKYIDDNGKLCDMTPYIGELGNDMYVQPVYNGFVMYNDKWKELLSGKKSIEIDDVNQILKEFIYIGDLKYVIDKFCNSIHNYNDYEVISTFINKMYEKKQRLIKKTEGNKEVYDAFGILATEIGNDFSIKNRAKFLHLLNEKQYSSDVQNSLLKIAEEKFNESLFLTIEKFMDDVEKECSIKFCFKWSLYLKKYHSYSEENRAKIIPSYLSSLEEANELFIYDAKENYDLFILFFTIKRLHSGEKQGFALTNKGLIYTNEQNQNCMVKYESIISFELTSKFLSTNLMMVTNDGKLIELKNDFNSEILNNAPIYIKSVIKEISASDIYIGNQENIINDVTTESNNTVNNNHNIKTNENDLVQGIKHDTEERSDAVSVENIDITSLSEILKSYFAAHVAKGTATASSKLIAGLSLPSDCEIYYAQDSTLFGSGKNGFAVTNKGIYTRKMFEKNVLIRPLEVLKTAKKFSADKSTPGLLLDGEFFVECSMAENLVPLFNGLIDYLHKYKIECDNSEKVTDKQLKYCPECGTPTKIQAKFCSKCGHKF